MSVLHGFSNNNMMIAFTYPLCSLISTSMNERQVFGQKQPRCTLATATKDLTNTLKGKNVQS